MARGLNYLLVATFVVLANVIPAGGTSFFISPATSPGSVTHSETAVIDISGGGSGSLGIWTVPLGGQNLLGIDLNLRVAESSGNAIDITSVTVANPLISGGPTKRWFDNGVLTGVRVDSVAADLVTGMIGATTTGTGTPGEGTGLNAVNGASDALFDSGSGAYLFATVDYDIINAQDSAELFLQIGDDGIGDIGGLVTSVIFGLADAALDASMLAQRNVDSPLADGATGMPAVAADYNSDGAVNAVDYLVFRNSQGLILDLPNRNPSLLGTPLGFGDYTYWKDRFGNTSGSGGSSGLTEVAVPEPSTLVMLLPCALLWLRPPGHQLNAVCGV